ncbi:MAG: tetratricopeptide repeat protein [candidate division NC10 bacterium]|nr:tetratricopeptide repeat protein [candidate division NC10 bacterium]
MAQPKLSKKELKEDEFLNTFERAIRYVSHHPRLFLSIGVALLLLIFAFTAARIFFERYEAKAARALYAANDTYRQNLSLISEDSPLERRGVPDFERPLKLYQEVLRLFPRSKSAREALYQSAECLYRLSRYDEAISAYEKYLQQARRGELSVLAALGLGNCYEHKGQLDRAADVYASAIRNNPSDPLIGEVWVSLGRCQEAVGKKEEALKTYTEITERFAGSAWKLYAERKLLYLKAH